MDTMTIARRLKETMQGKRDAAVKRLISDLDPEETHKTRTEIQVFERWEREVDAIIAQIKLERE